MPAEPVREARPQLASHVSTFHDPYHALGAPSGPVGECETAGACDMPGRTNVHWELSGPSHRRRCGTRRGIALAIHRKRSNSSASPAPPHTSHVMSDSALESPTYREGTKEMEMLMLP